MTRITQRQAEEIGRAYTAAWCAHDPEAVGSFYAEHGGISINGAEPYDGPARVAEMARGFIEAFPDLVLHMDGIRSSGTHALFQWTLEGHNTGPGGTGNLVKISGWEYWRFTENGQVAESLGHFDRVEYQRQLQGV